MFVLCLCLLTAAVKGMSIKEASDCSDPYLIYSPFEDMQHHSHMGLIAPPKRWTNEYANRLGVL